MATLSVQTFILHGNNHSFIFFSLSFLFLTFSLLLLLLLPSSPLSFFSPHFPLLNDIVRSSPSISPSPELRRDFPSISPTPELRRDPSENSPAPVEVRVRVGVIEYDEEMMRLTWEVCKGPSAVDYIPCLDNWKAIKALKSRRRMEHRERHCPEPKPRCLVPLPRGYKLPILWPKSRDMIWYDNVPHPKLVEYKKDQRWVVKSDDNFIFPGGGTQFKDGVTHYIDFIEKAIPVIKWGQNIRVILDVGCGVASFGGHLLDRNVLTMSFAPKDEHEAQIQFALERGIPATLSVIGTQQLTFPDNAYDLIHCARCRVHWHGDVGKPLLELNRVLRPGGLFIWSATPVYRNDEKHVAVWNAMVALTKTMCWKVVSKTMVSRRIGLVVYQKPISSSCYKERENNDPPMCDIVGRNMSWYTPLQRCLPQLPPEASSWPPLWPKRLTTKPLSLPTAPIVEETFKNDTNRWSTLVSDVYLDGLGINWSAVRNVMDMTAAHGGCEVIDLAVEIDRIVRPGGWILVQESKEMINKVGSIFQSLQWSVNQYNDRYLVGKKSLWRPRGGHVQR